MSDFGGPPHRGKARCRFMFERYSLPSRRAILYAREAALHAGAAEIDSMHLLSGLTREKSSRANALFKLAERFPDEAARIRAIKRVHEQNDIPLTDNSKRILFYTTEEANRMDDYWIDTDHLVLGILHERTCTAAIRLEATDYRRTDCRCDDCLADCSVARVRLRKSALVE